MAQKLTDDQKNYRCDLYGALYLLCTRWHSGQWSRGYRLLCRMERAGYRPGLSIREGNGFESEEQRALYRHYFRLRHTL